MCIRDRYCVFSKLNPARLRKFGLSSFKQLLLRATKKALTAYIYNDRNLGNRLQDGVPDTCHEKRKEEQKQKKSNRAYTNVKQNNAKKKKAQ